MSELRINLLQAKRGGIQVGNCFVLSSNTSSIEKKILDCSQPLKFAVTTESLVLSGVGVVSTEFALLHSVSYDPVEKHLYNVKIMS